MHMLRTITEQNPATFSRREVGGKAHRLKVLQDLDMPVPRWMVIPVYEMVESIRNAKTTASGQPLFPKWEERLYATFGEAYKDIRYAVRSSAPQEDGAALSYAGQFKTFLNVPYELLEERILEVRRSASGHEVSKYREQHGLDGDGDMAVIVQEMLTPESSGVAFGCDPLTGDREVVIVSAVYGLGEGLVSGQLDADEYRIRGGQIQAKIAEKNQQFHTSKENGVTKVPVPSSLRKKSVLEDAQLLEIDSVIRHLNAHFDMPQDIEFAYTNGRLYLLQTRDVTTSDGVRKGPYTVWDNSNIVESYPGVTTPLTFSFILKMYEQVYRQLGQLMGISKARLDRHKEVFEQTLGLVRGRVYYNLLNWYKMLSMVPGYSLNARFMERMMGVKERFELEEDFRLSKGAAAVQTLLSVVKMLGLQWNLRKETRRFRAFLDGVLKEYGALPFETMEARQILEYYRDFERKVLMQWKAPLINDFFTMIWFGLLEKQVQNLLPQQAHLHNALLCGSRDIISTEPIHRLLEIVDSIRREPRYLSCFKTCDAEEIMRQIEQGNFAGLRQQIYAYIDQYGDRCIGELKLESISYRIRPALLIEQIQSYLKRDATVWSLDSTLDIELRAGAEKQVSEALKGRPLKRKIFHLILRQARRLVSNRENLRFERTRAFGMVRRMFRALGQKWEEAGYLDDREDVFYLELEELLSAEGGVPPQNIRGIISRRKEEFEHYRTCKPPVERFYTYGDDFSDAYIYSAEKLEGAKGHLQGTGCCPGVVRAKVRVVRRPDEIDRLDGEILVTTSTDPGWVILFPSARGILVERGSLLSHAAIVSREMGIPCIVGIEGLMRSLKTGDEVLMDGLTGKISRL